MTMTGASPFTHLISALKKFVAANDGFLPVSASVPDMKADTTSFVALQRLYRAQAEKDAQTFKVCCIGPSPHHMLMGILSYRPSSHPAHP